MPRQTLDQLKRALRYDPETGQFFWLIKNKRRKVDDVAGALNRGYIHIQYDGHRYYAQQLAYWFMTGRRPPRHLEVGHIDTNRSNNRWSNLLLSTHSTNMQNLNDKLTKRNTSGHRGISWAKDRERWDVRITVKGRVIRDGYYPTLEEAIAARKQAEQRYFT